MTNLGGKENNTKMAQLDSILWEGHDQEIKLIISSIGIIGRNTC